MTIRIRPIQASDHARWLNLWNGYLQFYETALAPEVTARTWQRLLDPANPMHAIVAEDSTLGVVGFANYLLHENTWSTQQVCYLEDLFVDPAIRAKGIGRQLIDHLIAEMQAQNWTSLYWVTRETNYRARGLYDQYTQHAGVVKYAIKNT